jgi:acyl carrier protein
MLDKLTAIIREYLGDNSVEVTEGTILIADLGFSSFDLVQLASVVEDEFDVEIPDRMIKHFKTVGDVVSFLTKQ